MILLLVTGCKTSITTLPSSIVTSSSVSIVSSSPTTGTSSSTTVPVSSNSTTSNKTTTTVTSTTNTFTTPTNKISDPSGDLFDGSGNNVTGEQYLDIIGFEMSLSDNVYTAIIYLNMALPAKTDIPTTFLEWDLFIDNDSNSSTGQPFPLVTNDIGPDYLVRLTLQDTKFRPGAINLKTQSGGTVAYKIDKNVITLNFVPEAIGNPVSFNYVVATRKYKATDPANEPSVSDKAPNLGHFILH